MRQPGLPVRLLYVTALGVVGLLLWPAAAAQAAPACWFFCTPPPTTTPPPVTVTTVKAPAPVVAPAPLPVAVPPVIAEVPAAGTVMIALINTDRAAAGLAPLKLRDDISAFSSGHAKAMAEKGDIWHNDAFFTSATKQRFGARRVGENVARHSGIQAAHTLLMNSPGHRANLLSPTFRAVGIAAWANGGTVFVAQNFIEPMNGDGSAPAVAGPASKPAAAPTTAAPAKAAAPRPVTTPAPAPAVLAAAPPVEAAGPQGAVETETGGLVPLSRGHHSLAGALPLSNTGDPGRGWPTVMASAFLMAVLAALGRRLVPAS